MAFSPIPVLIVEDSPVALTLLKRVLSSSPEITIAGVARDGIEALEMIPKVQPKVICTDLHMPRMSGLELTQRVMAEFPTPILVISASVDKTENPQNVFQLLQAGALDVFLKPSVGLLSDYEQVQQELITRIKILSGVSVFTQHSSKRLSPPPPPSTTTSRLSLATDNSINRSVSSRATNRFVTLPQIVAIGASTGGPQALYTILKALPANFPVPILCVQHISEGFLDGLTNWLASACQLKVTIAQNGDVPKPSIVYFSPDHCHLRLNAQGRFVLSQDEPVCGHRPSVSVLFQSVAEYYKRGTLGVLLTGMGRDGADGLLAITQAGGTTIAQDEQSSVVFGMPREAIALGAAQHILALPDIAPKIIRHCLTMRS